MRLIFNSFIFRFRLGKLITQSAAPWGLDVTLLSEAHGLVTDLLLESATMPPQLASGLKALANLLSPPLPQLGAHGGGPVMDRRPRHTLPHVALSDVQYASDTEEIPYTGETLLHLSKVMNVLHIHLCCCCRAAILSSIYCRRAPLCNKFFGRSAPNWELYINI